MINELPTSFSAMVPRDSATSLIRRARQIFIAYSHSDLRQARVLRRKLVRMRQGASVDSVFLDQESLQPSEDISPQVIDQQLRASDLIIVLCGKDTHERREVQREIDLGLSLRRSGKLKILPIILPRVRRLPSGLDFEIQAIFLTTLFPEIWVIRIVVSIIITLFASGAITTGILWYDAKQEVRRREAAFEEEQTFKPGDALHSTRDYKNAVSEFSRILRGDPQNYRALVARAEVYLKMNRYEQALADLNLALEQRPDEPSLYSLRGMIYMRMKRLEDALIELNLALDLRPNAPRILTSRSIIYRKMKRLEDALTDLNLALDLKSNDPWILTHRGHTQKIFGYFEEALVDLNLALKHRDKNKNEPDYAWILTHRGAIYRKMRRYQKAMADLNRALRLSPDNDWIATHRALTYRAMGRYKEALKDLDFANRLKPESDWILAHRGRTYKDIGQYKEAREDFNRALEFNPNNKQVMAELKAIMHK